MARAVTTAPYRYQARILVHAPPEVVAEHVPPSVAMLEPDGDGECVLTSGSDSLEQLVFHAGMMGLDFTVLEPPELVGRLRVLAARLSQAAGPP